MTVNKMWVAKVRYTISPKAMVDLLHGAGLLGSRPLMRNAPVLGEVEVRRMSLIDVNVSTDVRLGLPGMMIEDKSIDVIEFKLELLLHIILGGDEAKIGEVEPLSESVLRKLSDKSSTEPPEYDLGEFRMS